MSLAEFVRRHDPDRFLTALFAPPEKREALLTLYAFNHELARAREVVSEPPLALIRLQWWREVVEGEHRRHEIAEPLAAAADAGWLKRDDMLSMIDAREAEAEPAFETKEQWYEYLRGSAGSVAVAAGHLLNAPEPEQLRAPGTAYGIAGLLRSVGVHGRNGRCLLPLDELGKHGLTPDHVIAEPSRADPVVRALAREGLSLLAPIDVPRRAIAAALPAVLARRDLNRVPGPVIARGLADRAAVMVAGFTGRI